jgi:hypothetical protein
MTEQPKRKQTYDEETQTLYLYDDNGKLIKKTWIKDYSKSKEYSVGRRWNGLAL